MRIILIQCPVWGTYDPPIGLAQLSGALKGCGNQVHTLDLNIKLYRARTENYKNMWAWEQSSFWYDRDNVDRFFSHNRQIIGEFLAGMMELKPEIIGFSVSAASELASLKLAGMIKSIDKDIRIVFGGPLFFEERFVGHILENDCVDIVIRGEGEVVFSELARGIEARGGILSCPGVYFKEDGQIKHNRGEALSDLDELPFADFSDLPLSDYDDNRHIVFMSSRGCIQRCAFCSSRIFWPGYRSMSGKRIFKEIDFQIGKLRESNPDLYHVDFIDLMFNGNMRALNEFCDLIIKSGLKIFWTANMIIRPEMDSRIIKKMYKSGCEHVIFGVESGSQRVLGLMKKNYRIKDADKIVKELHNAGIRVTANFMFGFPGETEEDFKETLDFIRRNAKFLDRVYPSRTYCAIEEFSYLAGHLSEFDIKKDPPNHLYWESNDGRNTYPERLKRCEEFCAYASSLGVEVGNGVQTSVELDRYFNLGHYYEAKGDTEKARDCYLRYHRIDPKNETIANKIKDQIGVAL